ncbi:MAG: S8 family serine peptidase [Myxococcota bacterium]|nr:S8 family serine peptidase [Myxococcota bacterium]
MSLIAALATWTTLAPAQSANGAAIVRLLGARAKDAFAPRGAPGMGAVVRLPANMRAADVGLQDLAPGFARLWGQPRGIVAFASAHPDLRVEVSPPLHLLLDTAAAYVGATAANASGYTGKNVLIGIADTGIDLTHPNFQDASGATRVEWLLDLSAPPIGKYPDLERQYGSTDMSGKLVAGAIWAKADIDALLASKGSSGLPKDEIGHGTLVASCAAGQDARYRGVAPDAGLLIARITDPGTGAIGNDELLRGVKFLFDRADFRHQPVVVNLSIGTDFGPHDGTLAWEQALASHVGSTQPGHALVVAAGNSGSIAETPVHQSVHVSRGSTMRVPLTTRGASQSGSVQIWVATHSSAELRVGLDGPDGTWISPVGNDTAVGKNTTSYDAAVYNGSQPTGSPIPAESHGAVVVWQGQWPAGTYHVTLSGSGMADLYVMGTGDVANPGDVGFADAVRESTINLPATHPEIIGVGCTINKKSWQSAGGGISLPSPPPLDTAGGEFDPNATPRDLFDGEPCWFSSAGPTLMGLPKPEILAPGAAIIGAMSQEAIPPVMTSIFTTDCPSRNSARADPRCEQIDRTHGVSAGTSFSAPLVAGAVALLFERDPSLTQDDVRAALQGGAHRLRGTALFGDQAGAGELDVPGALAVVDRLHDPRLALPVRSESWMVLGADVYLADGSTPLEAIVELRTARVGNGTLTAADGFMDGRLAAYAFADGSRQVPPSLRRAAPGVWVATVQLPAGLGGSRLTVGVTFDGVDIVDAKSVPIATDVWNAEYPPSVRGGCASTGGTGSSESALMAIAVGAAIATARRRRRPQ